MPRMIDADLAQRIADKNLSVADAGTVQWVLSHTPSVVCAEVVRYKDCVYSFRNNGHEKEGCPINDANIWLGENGFCSLGERRGADATD